MEGNQVIISYSHRKNIIIHTMQSSEAVEFAVILDLKLNSS